MVERPDWPKTLTYTHVHSGFRPEQRFSGQARKQPWLKRRELREGNSNAHLALVRGLWCSLGHERQGIQCHHLYGGPARKERGVGRKSTDRRVVPMVWFRHEEVGRSPNNEYMYFMLKGGINPYSLAEALFINSGSRARMGRILVAHQLQGTKLLLDPKALAAKLALFEELPPDQWATI